MATQYPITDGVWDNNGVHHYGKPKEFGDGTAQFRCTCGASGERRHWSDAILEAREHLAANDTYCLRCHAWQKADLELPHRPDCNRVATLTA